MNLLLIILGILVVIFSIWGSTGIGSTIIAIITRASVRSAFLVIRR